MSSPSAGRKVPKSNPETAHMLPIISLPGIRGPQNEPFYYLLSALIFPAALMKNHYCILPEHVVFFLSNLCKNLFQNTVIIFLNHLFPPQKYSKRL
jgi:hypothetical protein